jgi:hypothetical protein
MERKLFVAVEPCGCRATCAECAGSLLKHKKPCAKCHMDITSFHE